jgi:hypothetical protein
MDAPTKVAKLASKPGLNPPKGRHGARISQRCRGPVDA